MSCKGIGLALACVLSGAPVWAQRTEPVELVCNGDYSFGFDGKFQSLRSDGVYVRIEAEVVRIAGGVGDLNNAYAIITKNNEAEVSFDSITFNGTLNRYSGRLAVFADTKPGERIDYIFEATCSRPKPLF